jgi:hypothetical protein
VFEWEEYTTTLLLPLPHHYRYALEATLFLSITDTDTDTTKDNFGVLELDRLPLVLFSFSGWASVVCAMRFFFSFGFSFFSFWSCCDGFCLRQLLLCLLVRINEFSGRSG